MISSGARTAHAGTDAEAAFENLKANLTPLMVGLVALSFQK